MAPGYTATFLQPDQNITDSLWNNILRIVSLFNPANKWIPSLCFLFGTSAFLETVENDTFFDPPGSLYYNNYTRFLCWFTRFSSSSQMGCQMEWLGQDVKRTEKQTFCNLGGDDFLGEWISMIFGGFTD